MILLSNIINDTWGIQPGYIFGFCLIIMMIAIVALWVRANRIENKYHNDLMKVNKDYLVSYHEMLTVLKVLNSNDNDLQSKIDDWGSRLMERLEDFLRTNKE